MLITTVLYILPSLKHHIFHFVIFPVTSDFLWLVDEWRSDRGCIHQEHPLMLFRLLGGFVLAYVVCTGWDALLAKSFCFL